MDPKVQNATQPPARLGQRYREHRADAIRKEIIDAAIAEFAERGNLDAPLASIAERIGTRPSTIYNYFANKQEILQHAVAETIARLSGLMESAVSQVPISLEAVRATGNAFGDHLSDLFFNDPNTLAMLLAVARSNEPAVSELWTQWYEQAIGLFEAALNQGISAGIVRADVDVRSTAIAMTAIPFGVAACNPAAYAHPEQSQAVVRATTAIFTDGIRPIEA